MTQNDHVKDSQNSVLHEYVRDTLTPLCVVSIWSENTVGITNSAIGSKFGLLVVDIFLITIVEFSPLKNLNIWSINDPDNHENDAVYSLTNL